MADSLFVELYAALHDTLPDDPAGSATPAPPQLTPTAMPGLKVREPDATRGWKLAEGHTFDQAVVDRMQARAKAKGYILDVKPMRFADGRTRHQLTIYNPKGQRMSHPTEFYDADQGEPAAEPDQYAARHIPSSPGQQSLFDGPHRGHDVSSEPRDAKGEWTKGGAAAPKSDAPEPKTELAAKVQAVYDKHAWEPTKITAETRGDASREGARRTKNSVHFEKPIVGPSGAALHSYDWQWMWYEGPEYDDPVRISDWDRSESSEHTGREIVHHFHVSTPGERELKTVSLESAIKMMGFGNNLEGIGKVRNLAQAAMQLAQHQQAHERLLADATDKGKIGHDYRVRVSEDRLAALQDRVQNLTHEAEIAAKGESPDQHYRNLARRAEELATMFHQMPGYHDKGRGDNISEIAKQAATGRDEQQALYEQGRSLYHGLVRSLNRDAMGGQTPKTPILDATPGRLGTLPVEPWSKAKIRNWYFAKGKDAEQAVAAAEDWLKQHHPNHPEHPKHQELRDYSKDMRHGQGAEQANANYRRTGRMLPHSYLAVGPDNRVVRIDGSDVTDTAYFEARGYRRISEPVPRPDDRSERDENGSYLYDKTRSIIKSNWAKIHPEVQAQYPELAPQGQAKYSAMLYDALTCDRYARLKSQAGQRGLFDQDQHPRGQPENAGEFRPKESGPNPDTTGQNPDTPPLQNVDTSQQVPTNPDIGTPGDTKEPWEMTWQELRQADDAEGYSHGWSNRLRRHREAIAAKHGAENYLHIPPHQLTLNEYLRGEIKPKTPYGSGMTVETAREFHRAEVEGAIAEGEAVPPEVLADYPDLKPAPAPGTTAPSAGGRPTGETLTGPGGGDAAVNPFREKADQLQRQADALHGGTSHERAMANAFPLGTGVPGNASSHRTQRQFDKRIDASIDRAKRAIETSKRAAAMNLKADQFEQGLIDANGLPTPKAQEATQQAKQRQQVADATIADYLRSTLKPGHTVYVQGNPIQVKRVNPKGITTDMGSKWSYDEIMPAGPAGEMSRKDFVAAIRAWQSPSPEQHTALTSALLREYYAQRFADRVVERYAEQQARLFDNAGGAPRKEFDETKHQRSGGQFARKFPRVQSKEVQPALPGVDLPAQRRIVTKPQPAGQNAVAQTPPTRVELLQRAGQHLRSTWDQFHAQPREKRLGQGGELFKSTVAAMQQHLGEHVTPEEVRAILGHAGMGFPNSMDADLIADQMIETHSPGEPVNVGHLVLDAHSALRQANRDQRRQDAVEQAGDAKAMKFAKPNSDVHFMVHPAAHADYQGQWQITRFDDRGPSGHQYHKTKEEAIGAAIGAHPNSYWDEGDADYRLVEQYTEEKGRLDLYTALWCAQQGLDRYAVRPDPRQTSLFDRPVTVETRGNQPGVTVQSPLSAALPPPTSAILPPRHQARHAELLAKGFRRTPAEQQEFQDLGRRIEELQDAQRLAPQSYAQQLRDAILDRYHAQQPERYKYTPPAAPRFEPADPDHYVETARRSAEMRLPRQGELTEDARLQNEWTPHKAEWRRKLHKRDNVHLVDVPTHMLQISQRDLAPERKARLDQIQGTDDPVMASIDHDMTTGALSFNVDDGNNRTQWHLDQGHPTVPVFLHEHRPGDMEKARQMIAPHHAKLQRATYRQSVQQAFLDRYRDLTAQPEQAPPTTGEPIHHTKTAEFKNWFGDWEAEPHNASKVRHPEGHPKETHNIPGTGSHVKGPTGQPIPVYHGTAQGGFQAFDPAKASKGSLYGPGFYFTEDPEIAKEYTAKDADYRLERPITRRDMDRARRFFQSNAAIRDARNDIGTRSVYRKAANALQQAYDSNDPSIYQRYLERDEEGDRFRDMHKVQRLQAGNPEVKTAYLNIRNPLDIDVGHNDELRARLADAIKGTKPEELLQYTGEGEDFLPNLQSNMSAAFRAIQPMMGPTQTGAYMGSTFGQKIYDTLVNHLGKSSATHILQKAGFDGITHLGGSRMGKKPHRVWIAFKPHQIKSVTNRGTWDPEDERMDYEQDQNPVAYTQNRITDDTISEPYAQFQDLVALAAELDRYKAKDSPGQQHLFKEEDHPRAPEGARGGAGGQFVEKEPEPERTTEPSHDESVANPPPRPAAGTESRQSDAKTVANHDNQDLVARVQAGDKTAFDRLLAQNRAFIADRARKAGAREGHDIEDWIQEGSVILWRAAEKFDAQQGNKFLTYLGTALDRRFWKLREQQIGTKAKPKPRHLQGAVDDEGRPVHEPIASPDETPLAEQELKQAVRTVVEKIPNPRHKQILKLAYGLDGPALTHAEIAEQLGVRPQAVQQQLARILPTLQRQLQDQYAARCLRDAVLERYHAIVGGTPERYAKVTAPDLARPERYAQTMRDLYLDRYGWRGTVGDALIKTADWLKGTPPSERAAPTTHSRANPPTEPSRTTERPGPAPKATATKPAPVPPPPSPEALAKQRAAGLPKQPATQAHHPDSPLVRGYWTTALNSMAPTALSTPNLQAAHRALQGLHSYDQVQQEAHRIANERSRFATGNLKSTSTAARREWYRQNIDQIRQQVHGNFRQAADRAITGAKKEYDTNRRLIDQAKQDLAAHQRGRELLPEGHPGRKTMAQQAALLGQRIDRHETSLERLWGEIQQMQQHAPEAPEPWRGWSQDRPTRQEPKQQAAPVPQEPRSPEEAMEQARFAVGNIAQPSMRDAIAQQSALGKLNEILKSKGATPIKLRDLSTKRQGFTTYHPAKYQYDRLLASEQARHHAGLAQDALSAIERAETIHQAQGLQIPPEIAKMRQTHGQWVSNPPKDTSLGGADPRPRILSGTGEELTTRQLAAKQAAQTRVANANAKAERVEAIKNPAVEHPSDLPRNQEELPDDMRAFGWKPPASVTAAQHLLIQSLYGLHGTPQRSFHDLVNETVRRSTGAGPDQPVSEADQRRAADQIAGQVKDAIGKTRTASAAAAYGMSPQEYDRIASQSLSEKIEQAQATNWLIDKLHSAKMQAQLDAGDDHATMLKGFNRLAEPTLRDAGIAGVTDGNAMQKAQEILERGRVSVPGPHSDEWHQAVVDQLGPPPEQGQGDEEPPPADDDEEPIPFSARRATDLRADLYSALWWATTRA